MFNFFSKFLKDEAFIVRKECIDIFNKWINDKKENWNLFMTHQDSKYLLKNAFYGNEGFQRVCDDEIELKESFLIFLKTVILKEVKLSDFLDFHFFLDHLVFPLFSIYWFFFLLIWSIF